MNANIQHALQSLFTSVEYDSHISNLITVNNTDTALASSIPLADLATAVMAAQATVLTDLHKQRTGQTQRVSIDRFASSLAMAANNYLRVDKQPVDSWDPLTGYYRTADNEWVYCHTNFPHHRDGLLKMLDCRNDREALTSAIAGWNADELEQRTIELGVCVTRLRTRDQWQSHPQCTALNSQPVISLTKIGDSDPMPLADPPSNRPLSGVRMLDLSRVIAGPMAGRTLAEHGACVMLVSGPQLPAIEPLVIDTGPGKHSTFLDLSTPVDLQHLGHLISDADVFLDGFRPNALARFALNAETLARKRPGIIYVSISAFSDVGPWAGRRGYDTFVQATTGLAQDTGSGDPQRLPCQPLDYMTGYLCAFGAMVALHKRATQGGSWHVEMSLARTANWIWEMSDVLQHELNPPAQNPLYDDIQHLCYERDTAFGHVSALSPVIQFSETPAQFVQPPVPLGTHEPQWPPF